MAVRRPILTLPNLPDGAWIVHVAPRDFDPLRHAVPAERVVLVEPDPVRAAARPEKQVKSGMILLDGALGRESGAILRRYNQPRIDGFAVLPEAAKLYPGLRERQCEPVEGLALETLLTHLPVDDCDLPRHMLLIEMVGEGALLLKRFAEKGGLGRFGTIWLRGIATMPSIEVSEAETLGQLLETEGFSVRYRPGDDDPDLVWIIGARRPPSPEVLALREGQAELAEALGNRERKIAQVQSDLETAQLEIAQLEVVLEDVRRSEKEEREAAALLKQEVGTLRAALDAREKAGHEAALQALDEIGKHRAKANHERRLRRLIEADLAALRCSYRDLLTSPAKECKPFKETGETVTSCSQ